MPLAVAYVVFFVSAYSLGPVGENVKPAVAIFFNTAFALVVSLISIELLKKFAALVSDRLAGRKEADG